MTVYIAKSSATGAFKIGFTSRAAAERVREIEMAHGASLDIVCTVEGSRQDEARLHRRFRAHRGLGEWFSGADMEAFATRLAAMSVEQARAEIALETLENTSDDSDSEDIRWHHRVAEIVEDACIAVIRRLGAVACASALSRWVRPVLPRYVAGGVEGRNYLRGEWLLWFSRQSGAVRDGLKLIGVGPADREAAYELWSLSTALRAEIGDEAADALIARAEAR